ncbi:MAG TPA: hydrogenase iron-sulfur subunit [Thermoleophilia bacterium]|nr:hydrogenase iron-sulfur subunit [Thermoleophilia bacterium]
MAAASPTPVASAPAPTGAVTCADTPQDAMDAAAAAARAGAQSGDRAIVAFFCRECAYAAADATGNARISLPPTIRSILMPCTGRVNPLHLLTALAEGADGVYVAGCLEGQCHYREGNFHAIDRVTFVQRLLESVGVEPQRCQMFTMSAADSPKFVAAARTMDKAIGDLPRLERGLMATTAGSSSAATGKVA